MKKLTVVVALVGMLFSAVQASAAVIRQFDVTDNAGGVAAVGTQGINGGNPYGFYINNSTLTGGGNKHFNVVGTGLMQVLSNGTASIVMSITNSIKSYDVSLTMSEANPAYAPKYPNATYENYVLNNGLLPWASWEMNGLSLSSGGNVLYSLGASPGTGGQEGVAANWVNPYEYGFSAWIDGTAQKACYEKYGHNCAYRVDMDINVGLTRKPIGGTIPLPAGMVLMLSGLAGFGLMTRRRKS